MIQTKPYEFMVRYTPQREWIEKRGILMWLAMFFIELGAGAFAVSSIFGNPLGMFLGWLMCGVLGGGLHLIYLGHPFRFWRMILSSGWKSSWISRGLIFVVLFLTLGLVHMILLRFASPSTPLLIAADIFAFMTVIYAGFVMNYVNGIPLWNTPLLPVLYVILGTWGGLGVTLLTLTGSGVAPAAGVEEWSRIFLFAFVFIVIVYLFSIRYQGATGKASVLAIVAGRWAPLFWIMVVALGSLFPLGMALGAWLAGWTIQPFLLYTLILFELIGDLSLRYCVLRAGLYAPLIPSLAY
jgi:formate-dependent nitrite reductase membrane component NrfD